MIEGLSVALTQHHVNQFIENRFIYVYTHATEKLSPYIYRTC